MKEDKKSSKENEHPGLENGKKKGKEEKPATKVVIRRLPPSMTEEQFKEQVAPLPDNDYFYFVPADLTLGQNAFSRAYINFIDQNDLFIFTQKFDGYVFIDSKGGEFPAVVEFAPFQRIPKNRPNRKKDAKMGTIETDPCFIAFKERIEAEKLENKATITAPKQHFFETSSSEKKELTNTPLLDFIKNKKAERQRIRDEKLDEKRKKNLERRKLRKTKKEDETCVVKVVLNSPSVMKDRPKEKELKQSLNKKKSDDAKSALKEKSSVDPKIKENKSRVGKSYFEERQRLAERREEQKKKLSHSQSGGSIADLKFETVSEEKVSRVEKKEVEEPSSLSESKSKDNVEYKKPERVHKREDIKRKSDKYDSKRDREDDAKKTKRLDRNHQISKREDDRSEDGGRKRYSETRKSHDTTKDKYRDKDKIKTSNQKKNIEPGFDKDKNETGVNEVKREKVSSGETEIKDGDTGAVKETSEDVRTDPQLSEKHEIFEPKNKSNPTRRKSFDQDKITYSSNNGGSKSNIKDKDFEIKRRNSVGSNKPDKQIEEIGSFKDSTTSKDKILSKVSSDLKVETEFHDKESNFSSELDMVECKDIEREEPKRRNSTGDRTSLEKVPTGSRRSSLGSEEKNKVFCCNMPESGRDLKPEEENIKVVIKRVKSDRDPRTERRIRNKDRPTMEIYRPGMGKFSKQRMGKEKVLGSSTEVESPSSSPSPTPVIKHRTATQQH